MFLTELPEQRRVWADCKIIPQEKTKIQSHSGDRSKAKQNKTFAKLLLQPFKQYEVIYMVIRKWKRIQLHICALWLMTEREVYAHKAFCSMWSEANFPLYTTPHKSSCSVGVLMLHSQQKTELHANCTSVGFKPATLEQKEMSFTPNMPRDASHVGDVYALIK